MKIREINFNDFNKCYPGHKQHSRGCNRQLNTLGNVNADIIIFKSYNSKST